MAAMREGRRRPSLGRADGMEGRLGAAAMREGRRRPSLQRCFCHTVSSMRAAMREGRRRPSLAVLLLLAVVVAAPQ